MKVRWERFLTATQAEKSRLKTIPTAVEFFMAQDVDAIDMNVVRVSLRCARHSIVGQRKKMLPGLRYFQVFIETAFTLRRCVRLSFFPSLC